MIELVVFDMAGTTVDEGNVVYKTVREAINAAGYGFTQEQVHEYGAGKEKSQAIRDVLALDGNNHPEEEVQTIFADFKTRLKTAYASLEVREQAGAGAVFSQLHSRGVKVALNTGYDRKTAEGLVAKIGWVEGKDFDVLVTASDVENGRPAPDMIHLAMQHSGVSEPKRVMKVGDSQIDIEEGQSADCGVVLGITTGAQTERQLAEAKPTKVVHCLDDILTELGEG